MVKFAVVLLLSALVISGGVPGEPEAAPGGVDRNLAGGNASNLTLTPEELKAAEEKKAALAEKIEQKKEADTGPLVLLLAVVGIMMVFWMVNSKHKTFVVLTWNVVSTSISIFAAVATYNLVKKFFSAVSHGHAEKEAAEGGVKVSEPLDIMFVFLYLIMWWLVTVGVLYLCRNSSIRLLGYGTILGHILGFAIIAAYGSGLAESEFFRMNQWTMLLLVLIYILTAPLITLPTAFLGRCCKDTEKLHDQAKDTASDMFCMGLSLLIAVFFRSWITIGRTGEVAGVEAEGQHTIGEVGTLTLVAIMFFVLAGILHLIRHKATVSEASIAGTVLNTVNTTVAMTAAWCFLGAAQWFILARMVHEEEGGAEGAEGAVGAEGAAGEAARRLRTFTAHGHTLEVTFPQGEFMAHCLVACFFSLVFLVAVLCFWALKTVGVDKSVLKGSMTAVALVVGLGWEHLFDVALEEVAKMANNEQDERWLTCFLTFVLVIIVLPAWMVYILPKHADELEAKYAKKKLSIFTCCGDCCDDSGDEETGYDECEEEDE